MASRWNKCTVVSEMDNPSLCPCRCPIDLMITILPQIIGDAGHVEQGMTVTSALSLTASSYME